MLELRTKWSDVTLDFTDAVIRESTLRIDMKMRGWSLILVTGPGMVVDANSLAARFTNLAMGSAASVASPVVLHVELAGRVRHGHINAHCQATTP